MYERVVHPAAPRRAVCLFKGSSVVFTASLKALDRLDLQMTKALLFSVLFGYKSIKIHVEDSQQVTKLWLHPSCGNFLSGNSSFILNTFF